MQFFPTAVCNVTAWLHSRLRAHWLMTLVWGWGSEGEVAQENCSVSYLSFVNGRSLWSELNGGENFLHWKANMLPLFSIMTLWFYCVSGWADTGGRLALWYHVYGSLWTAKIIQTKNLIITREAGWRYGIMSTVPLWTSKIIQTKNIIIAREVGLTPREPSISQDVYDQCYSINEVSHNYI